MDIVNKFEDLFVIRKITFPNPEKFPMFHEMMFSDEEQSEINPVLFKICDRIEEITPLVKAEDCRRYFICSFRYKSAYGLFVVDENNNTIMKIYMQNRNWLILTVCEDFYGENNVICVVSSRKYNKNASHIDVYDLELRLLKTYHIDFCKLYVHTHEDEITLITRQTHTKKSYQWKQTNNAMSGVKSMLKEMMVGFSRIPKISNAFDVPDVLEKWRKDETKKHDGA